MAEAECMVVVAIVVIDGAVGQNAELGIGIAKNVTSVTSPAEMPATSATLLNRALLQPTPDNILFGTFIGLRETYKGFDQL